MNEDRTFWLFFPTASEKDSFIIHTDFIGELFEKYDASEPFVRQI